MSARFHRRTVKGEDLGIGSAIHTGGRLQFVHKLERDGEHLFATIAPAGIVPHARIRVSGSDYQVSPSTARLMQRFFEDDVHDGAVDYTREEWEFTAPDTLYAMAGEFTREYVTFAATGHADYATDPDGSQAVDYGTGEREIISMWARGLTPGELDRLADLVDNRRVS